MVQKRKLHGTWASRWTFILAATGSAVGLGNIWKFPYIAGENGGGAFVLVYLACIAVIGIPIMIAEVLLGRRGRQSPINGMADLALEANASKVWSGIGWLGVLAGLLILSYYTVIAGWILEYVFSTAAGNFKGVTAETANAMFETFLADESELIKWQSVFMLMTVGVVVGGVTKGLGVAVRILMPLLFVLLIVMLFYGVQQGDFPAAFSFLFSFNFQNLTWHGVLIALGHAFFTLSLGMGAIMAYGAYMPEKASIAKTVLTVGVLDTLVALVAGLAIFPVVFANPGIEPGEGQGLMFISLPVAFGNMQGGVLFGTVFFVLVGLAAWSSAISLIEPAVAWLIESKNFNRIAANIVLALAAWVVGLGTVFSFNRWAELKVFFGMTFFGFLDFLTTSIMLPLSGILIAVFVGWVMRRDSVRQELKEDSTFIFDKWMLVLKFVSPVAVFIVFVVTLYSTFS